MNDVLSGNHKLTPFLMEMGDVFISTLAVTVGADISDLHNYMICTL